MEWIESNPVRADGRIEPGEEGEVRITLAHYASTVLDGVTGTLRDAEGRPGLVVAGAASWPSLPAGRSASSVAGGFTISLGGSDCSGPVHLALDLTAPGEPPTTLDIFLGVGAVVPAVGVVEPMAGQSGDDFTIAWNGWAYGAAWTWEFTGEAQFVRLDATGAPLSWPPLLLDGTPTTRSLSLCEGGTGWGLTKRLRDGRIEHLVIAADGTMTARTPVATASEGRNAIIQAAWDGTGWGMWWTAPAGAVPPYDWRRMLYAHLLVDGTLDVPPREIWLGGEVIARRSPLAWDGYQFVGVAVHSRGNDWLVRIQRDGTSSVAPMPFDVTDGSEVCMAAGSAGLLLVDNAAFATWHFSAAGDVHWGPLAHTPTFLQDDAWPAAQCSIGWNGEEYGLATAHGRPRVSGGYEWWTLFRSLTPEGRSYQRAVSALPPLTGESSALSSTACAFDRSRREWVVPIVLTNDTDALGQGQGALALQRHAASRACGIREPREVSPPGSDRPLLAHLETGRRCGVCPDENVVVLSVEDLGPEATAYNVVVLGLFGSDRRVPTNLMTEQAWCGLVPGVDPRAAYEAPGRIRLLAHHEPPSDDSMRTVHAYLVSASNADASGPWGTGTYGTSLAVRDTCAGAP